MIHDYSLAELNWTILFTEESWRGGNVSRDITRPSWGPVKRRDGDPDGWTLCSTLNNGLETLLQPEIRAKQVRGKYVPISSEGKSLFAVFKLKSARFEEITIPPACEILLEWEKIICFQYRLKSEKREDLIRLFELFVPFLLFTPSIYAFYSTRLVRSTCPIATDLFYLPAFYSSDGSFCFFPFVPLPFYATIYSMINDTERNTVKHYHLSLATSVNRVWKSQTSEG